MNSPSTALLVLLAGWPAAAPAAAAESDTLPTVLLKAPDAARRPTVQVLVQIRDCTTRPTVRVAARWRRAGGKAVVRVTGIDRVLRPSRRRAERRTDRLTFRRVRARPRSGPRRRRVARVRATLITNWRTAKPGATECKVRLPSVIGTGASAGAAESGVVRLRTPLQVVFPTGTPPLWGTGTDHIWACGGGRRGNFDCGLTVTIREPSEAAEGGTPADPDGGETAKDCSDQCDGDDDSTEGVIAVLTALALGVGGIGAAAAKRPKEGEEAPEMWDELARKEYAKPEQPVGAQAAFLTKVGAPAAGLVTSLLAAGGGLAVDAPKGPRVIAVAIVVAISVGGVMYVFATDFRSRAAVTVARYETLSSLATAEMEAKAAPKPEPEPATETEPAAARTFLPLPELQAKLGVEPTTLYGAESAGSNVVRYLARDAEGRLRWVGKDEVSDIGGQPS